MSSHTTSRAAPKKPRGSAKARRTAARLAAVQCLYEKAVADRPAADIVGEFIQYRIGHEIDGATFVPADVTLLTAIVRGADAEKSNIADLMDQAIKPPLERDRLELLLKSILSAGIWELRRNLDIPAPIIISEYVGVAVAFYGGPEPALINGVLDRVARQVRPHEFGVTGAGPIPGGEVDG